MSRVVLITALVACMVAGAYAGACKQDTFCERWMCQQNTNRRELLKTLLGASYSLAVLSDCNNQQGGTNLLSTTCNVPGFGVLDIGMRFDDSTCDQERPPQLAAPDASGANKMAVQAVSVALIQVNQSKNAEATKKYDEQKVQCGEAGFTPIHPCVCETATRDSCIADIRFDVFFDTNSPFFQQDYLDRFSGEFIQFNAIQNANLGVTDVNGAVPDATQNCISIYGAAACQTTSPAPATRGGTRKLRMRAL